MNAAVLEQLIESYRFIGTHEINHARQAELIQSRSPQRVEEMEIKKGLRSA